MRRADNGGVCETYASKDYGEVVEAVIVHLI